MLKEEIVAAVKNSIGFSIIADETADISGTEQLSIGIRFVDQHDANAVIREEFLGFVPLINLDAESIADTIISAIQRLGLDLNDCLGQGYDGCSTIAGKDNGVQARIRRIYEKALFVHCSSHRLNLVVNDLNSVMDVRNTVGTIKSIIAFFRDSPKRRAMIPNVPLLSETRWTAKYKSIRVFAKNFPEIFKKLEELKNNRQESQNTRQAAHQLICASGSASFLTCLKIIEKYSAILEPVTQQLQGVEMDVLQVREHIKMLTSTIESHREDASTVFAEDILPNVESVAEELDIDMIVPRRCNKQVNRAIV